MASNEEQTCARPEDVPEAQILETHGVHHLVERKQKTTVKGFDNAPKMTINIHSRSIDDRCYDVKETLTEGMDEPERVIETEMTQEEVERFEEDWSTLQAGAFIRKTVRRKTVRRKTVRRKSNWYFRA